MLRHAIVYAEKLKVLYILNVDLVGQSRNVFHLVMSMIAGSQFLWG